jgi:hypothetical protein
MVLYSRWAFRPRRIAMLTYQDLIASLVVKYWWVNLVLIALTLALDVSKRKRGDTMRNPEGHTYTVKHEEWTISYRGQLALYIFVGLLLLAAVLKTIGY